MIERQVEQSGIVGPPVVDRELRGDGWMGRRVTIYEQLDLPGARLRAYRPETAIVEKFHAMVTLGSKNSRMRDFFDIDALAARQSFDGQALVDALRATFERRSTKVPAGLPLALTPAFAASSEKQAQWAWYAQIESMVQSIKSKVEEIINEDDAILA